MYVHDPEKRAQGRRWPGANAGTRQVTQELNYLMGGPLGVLKHHTLLLQLGWRVCVVG